MQIVVRKIMVSGTPSYLTATGFTSLRAKDARTFISMNRAREAAQFQNDTFPNPDEVWEAATI